jgi:transposase InsO family protein
VNKYRFIVQVRNQYPVRLLCRVLGVGKSGLYRWLSRGGAPTVKQAQDAVMIDTIRRAHVLTRGVYGYRRITAELREQGCVVNRKRIARLMSLAGLSGADRRRRAGKPRQAERQTPPAPDLVNRQFTADAPDQLWVADATYLRTWEGWLYLAVVVDAFSRKVVGWSISDRFTSELVIDAFGMAAHRRQPVAGQVIHHSDRGCQYTSYAFGSRLRDSGVLASMGSVADAYDNAMAETFFATIKTELVYRRSWPTRHELETEIFSYIEGFYNRVRRHSALGYVSPERYEYHHAVSLAA